MKINGTTDTPPMDQYATKEWVQEQEYLDENELKTVNEESIVGEGDIETLSSSQESALGLLTSPSNGYLKYAPPVLPAMTCDMFTITGGWDANNIYFYVQKIDDEIYLFSRGEQALYKFNDEAFDFDYVAAYSQEYTGNVSAWQDTQGRTYINNTYQIDLTDGTLTAINMGGTFKQKYSASNIVVGQNHIYMLNSGDSYIFDESTQTFVVTSIVDFGTLTDPNWYYKKCWYEGKLLFCSGGTMWEFVETESGASFVEVTNPYFPTTITIDGSTENIFAGSVHKAGGDYYYIGSGRGIFKLVDGAWEDVTSSYTISQSTWTTSQYGWVEYGDLLIGGGYSYNTGKDETYGKLRFWNFGTEGVGSYYGWTTDIEDRLTALETSVGQAETITNEILG